MKRCVSIAVLMSIVALPAAAGPAHAYEPFGSDFRISNTGSDADADRDAEFADVVYNPTANEYLAVWDSDGLATNNEGEIFGQRLSATGAEIGSDFRISTTGSDGDTTRQADSPSVAYNSTSNQYLVVWSSDSLADGDSEIFGQRVSASGSEQGGDFRISNANDAGSGRDAVTPEVAVDPKPAANEYLVVWQGDGLATDNEREIFGQRVSGGGAELGTDFRISNVGADTDTQRVGEAPDVVFNRNEDEYLVTWDGNELAAADFEAYGQRVSATGSEVGSDFRISNTTDVGASRDAYESAVSFNSADDEYLVVWQGNGTLENTHDQVFGQRVSAAGAEVGSDFRISNSGSSSDGRDAQVPAVAYNSAASEYLVTWEGNGLTTVGEREIFGQQLTAGGSEIGTDSRISQMGPDGDSNWIAESSAVAYNSAADEYLVVFDGDGTATEEKEEVMGHRVGTPPPAPPASPGGGGVGTPGSKDLKAPGLTVAAAAKGAIAKRSLSVNVSCDEACAVVASGTVNVPGTSKPFKLTRVSGQAPAGVKAKLKLKFSKRLVAAAKRALKKGKRVKVSVNVAATDAAGNASNTTRTLRLTG